MPSPYTNRRRHQRRLVGPPQTEDDVWRFIHADLKSTETVVLAAEARILANTLSEFVFEQRGRDRHVWAWSDGHSIGARAWMVERLLQIRGELAGRARAKRR